MNSDLATFIDTLPYTVAEEQLLKEVKGSEKERMGGTREQ